MLNERLAAARREALAEAAPLFVRLDEIAAANTRRVLDAFRRHRVADFHFAPSRGYGYGDAGREKLDELWAGIMGAEKALVRTHFVSGTHALATVLFGLLRPGDELAAVTGRPYDTMTEVIGHHRPSSGSLAELGVGYREGALEDAADPAKLARIIGSRTRVALIQRSRGYSLRRPLSVAETGAICRAVKKVNPDCVCFVDNCYGEFVEDGEPTSAGADIMAGSLIKNPGGGLAPTGGYIAGRTDLVERAAVRLTAPGIGAELGATLYDPRILYQGLFLAPHAVSQALKSAVFAAAFFRRLGYRTFPSAEEPRGDIIQALELGSPEKMLAFCRGLQRCSPVNSHVRPEAAGMPGYEDAVVMAGGTFVQGSSIELSADGPLRPPYAVYLQGGLTFEHAVIAVEEAARAVEECGE